MFWDVKWIKFLTCWLFKLRSISEELPLKLEFIKFLHTCKFDSQVFSSNEKVWLTRKTKLDKDQLQLDSNQDQDQQDKENLDS